MVKVKGTFRNYVMKNMMVVTLKNLTLEISDESANITEIADFGVFLFDANYKTIQRTFMFYTQNNYLRFQKDTSITSK